MIDTEEHHRPGCPGGGIKYRPSAEGRRAQCRGCCAYWADHTSDPAQTEHPNIITGSVCREHGEPVSVRGKGCGQCAKARRDRDAKRTSKRIERRKKAADRARVGS